MVRFGTAGIRGDAVETVTPAVALAVGRAVASMASEVVLGKDGRTTSAGLADAAAAGLQSGGATVYDVGTVPTAVVAAASRGRLGLMITASHNPATDNGIKLFDDGIEFDRPAERHIEQTVADEPSPAAWSAWGDRRTIDRLSRYRDEVISYLDDHGSSPAGLTIAVDCGHGMGGLATPSIVTEFGADVKAVNATPDGHFPGRPSKPTPETLESFRQFVGESDANMGIAHDGDADRVVVLKGDGEIVHEDTILAIIAHHYVSRSDVDDPVVVTTPNASERVDDRVRAAGGRTERTALGGLHEGIAEVEQDDTATVVFAGEPWKHIHPAFGGWIDGIVSGGLIVRLAADAGGLAPLREPVTERPYRKRSIDCPDRQKELAMERIHNELATRFPDSSIDSSYGIRLTWPTGAWVLVRPSGTEPKLRIYLEAEDVDDRMSMMEDLVLDAISATVP